jgi:hypothetical protein
MKEYEVRESCIMRRSIPCIILQINYSEKIRDDEISEACNTYRGKRIAYRVLVGNPKGKGPLGRLRLRWEDNLRMGHRGIG